MKRLSLISLFRYSSDSHGHGILISQLGDPCKNIVAYLCGYPHIYGRPGPHGTYAYCRDIIDGIKILYYTGSGSHALNGSWSQRPSHAG